jgi:hypothetical protein
MVQNVWHVFFIVKVHVTVQFRKPGFDHVKDGVATRTPAPLAEGDRNSGAGSPIMSAPR